MKTFKAHLNEALSLEAVNKTPQDKEVTVFMGRMQPPTKAHIDIINNAVKRFNQPVVIAVVKSGNDQSPFPVKLIKNILDKSLNKKSKVIEIKSGFIGDFISPLRDKKLEPSLLIAGSDRVKGYRSQVKRYEELFNLNLEVKEIQRTSDDVSATKVRQALSDSDKETFKSMTAKGTWSFYKKLQRYV